jgi:hypothetical protein
MVNSMQTGLFSFAILLFMYLPSIILPFPGHQHPKIGGDDT